MSLLAEALAHGGRVVWDPPERPWLLLPKGVRERLEPDRETIREVMRRATVFRAQAAGFIREGRPLPTLVLPGHRGDRGCISCGAPAGPGPFRCPVCALAVALALEVEP